MTISKAQATNAVAYLEALSDEALYYMENDKTHTPENVAYNRDKQRGSLMVLRQFITEANQGLTDQQKKDMVENWINTLKWRFGGLDFWRLSKRWKDIRYAEIASIFVNELDWIIQNNNNPDFNKQRTKTMSVITRMFHWSGEYHKTINTLPTAGLVALRNELRLIKARQGINFNDEPLLEDVILLLTERLKQEYG